MIEPISSADSLTLQEIQAIHKNVYTGNSPYALLSKFKQDFSKIDTDSDGKISKKEFKSYLVLVLQNQSGSKPNVDDVVNAIFAKLDPHKTGYIDQNALTNVLQKMNNGSTSAHGKSSPHGGGEHGETAGTSSSGKSYDPRDTNKDGRVEPSEQIAWDLKHGSTQKKSDSDGDTDVANSEK